MTKWSAFCKRCLALDEEAEKPSLLFGMTTATGASEWYKGHFAKLVNSGVPVVLVTPSDDAVRQFATAEGARHVAVAMVRDISPVQDLRSLVQLISLLRRVRPAHAIWASPKASFLGCIASKILCIPTTYVVHGLRYEGEEGKKRRIVKRVEMVTMALADAVIPIGHGVSKTIERDQLCNPRKVQMVGPGSVNGIPDLPRVPKSQARRSLGVDAEAVVFAFVGRINRDKGIADLLRAWADLKPTGPTALLIAGASEGDRELDSLLTQPGPGVRYLGYRSDVENVYGASDVLVLPSRREGVPTVVLAASALGVPSIVTSGTGVSEATEHNVTGLVVEVGDVDGLSSAMARLSSDDQTRRRLGRSARAFVEKNYNRERVQEAWLRYYLAAHRRSLYRRGQQSPARGSIRSLRGLQ